MLNPALVAGEACFLCEQDPITDEANGLCAVCAHELRDDLAREEAMRRDDHSDYRDGDV